MGHTKAPVPGLFVIPSVNGWLEDDISLWGMPIFRGELLVSGSVDVTHKKSSFKQETFI